LLTSGCDCIAKTKNAFLMSSTVAFGFTVKTACVAKCRERKKAGGLRALAPQPTHVLLLLTLSALSEKLMMNLSQILVCEVQQNGG
jgi:hypothetical protein